MAKKRPPMPPPPQQRHVEKEGEITRTSFGGFVMPPTEFRPPKLVIVGVEGWGKTSLVANIPDVAILMPETETGYLTLVSAKRVPQVPCRVSKSWTETMSALDSMKGFKALGLDELSGFEKQCHEFVCNNNFKGSWEQFWAYHRGIKLVVPEWLKFLAKLEALNITIVALSHCAIETFKDPVNADHDRYVAALYRDTWGVTRRWADACLFGTFVSVVDPKTEKGIGGDDRILYTVHSDTHDAKNRYGMEPEIDIPEDPTAIWDIIINAVNNPARPVYTEETESSPAAE